MLEHDEIDGTRGHRSRCGRYVVRVWQRWNERASEFAHHVQGSGGGLFQCPVWLSSWYATVGQLPDVEPLIVGIESAKSGQLIMMLPLCRKETDGLVVVGFADLGLTDYNAPLLHDDARFSAGEIHRLLKDICKALPPADYLRLEKMPKMIGCRQNPLISGRTAHLSTLNHYGVEIGDSFDEYWSVRRRSFRKDQKRRWRVLEKMGKISTRWSRDPEQAAMLLDRLMQQQRQKLAEQGLPYLLDSPGMDDFYPRLTATGCRDGNVIVTALLVDDEPIATLFGLGDGQHYAMTISGFSGGAWLKASPGRLLTEWTMRRLHQEGYRYFDFTIGDEPYKMDFAAIDGQLYETHRSLSLKSLPHLALAKTKGLKRRIEAKRRRITTALA